MSSTQSFNEMLLQFVDELILTFPEETQLQRYKSALESLIKANAKKPMEMCASALGPHAQKIYVRDGTFFDDCPVLFDRIEIKRLWQKDISDNTRDAIWQYLNVLLSLATTVSMLPPDMLTSIESLAHQCVADIQSGKMDLGDITKMLSGGAMPMDLTKLLGS